MQDRVYASKESNAEKLTNEIITAGIAFGSRFFGVTYDSGATTTIVHVADDLTGPEGTTIDNTVSAHVPQTLAEAKTARKTWLKSRGEEYAAERYSIGTQQELQSLYSDAQKYRPNRLAYIQPWCNWLSEIATEVKNEQDLVDTKTTIPDVNAVVLDEATLTSHDPLVTIPGAQAVVDNTDLATFLNENAVVTDPQTGVQGPFYLMQELIHRREFYNDSENPLYDEDHIPALGAQGWGPDHANRIGNIENIHAKLGWHYQQVEQARYAQPKDLLIYYGWLNSFNSATNGWNNEKVAQDMSKYAVLVFGDGLQNPSHGDYANTQVIIPRIKALNPSALIFGYVTTAQALNDFKTKADQWNTLAVHGIFMDEAGYDYGKTRSEFNERVDYVHALSTSKLVFANAWNTDHILGLVNDPSYPNSTYNSGLVESNLENTDWALMESFPINTDSYTGTGGYEDKAGWSARGVKMQGLRATYGVNFAGSGIINDGNANGLALFKFGFVSSLMFSLEAWGTSDTLYGASTANTKFWTRPSAAGLGNMWTLNASVQVDPGDYDVYHRYSEFGHLKLDFSSSAEASEIISTSGQAFGIQGSQGAQGLQGLQGFQGPQGYQGSLGSQGAQGTTGTGSQGAQGPSGAGGTISTAKCSGDVSNSSTTLSDVTGLSFAVAADTDYAFQFTIVWSSSATQTGIRLDLNGPTSPTQITWSRETMLSGAAGTDAYQSAALQGYQADAATASVDSANARRVARIVGVLRNGSNAGTLQVRFASETSNSVTVYRGSWGLLF